MSNDEIEREKRIERDWKIIKINITLSIIMVILTIIIKLTGFKWPWNN